jgi:peroxiredoxin Q/BCP
LEAKNVVVLGVSFDSVEDNKHFAEKFKFPYPLLSDTSRAMGVQYGAAEEGSSGNAKRIAYLIGPDGKVKTVWPKANVATFAQDALAQL